MVGMFENILEQCTENGTFTLNKKKYSFLRIIFLYKDRCGDFDVGRCKSYIRSRNIQTCKLGMYYKGPYASEIRNAQIIILLPYKSFPFFVAYLCDFCL